MFCSFDSALLILDLANDEIGNVGIPSQPKEWNALDIMRTHYLVKALRISVSSVRVTLLDLILMIILGMLQKTPIDSLTLLLKYYDKFVFICLLVRDSEFSVV